MVQVRAATRAQPPAVALTNYFQGQRQQHLLLDHVRQEESFSIVESNFGIVVLQPVFFGFQILGQRRVKQVKAPVYFFHDRLQATRAHQLNLRFEVTLDTNLPFQQLRRRRYFQRLDLLDLRGMKIDAARSIRLPNAQLVDGQFLDVKEHVFSASGAYAHAVPLFSRPTAKSRKRLSRFRDFEPSWSLVRSSTLSAIAHSPLTNRAKNS